ncbi:uncharacterized protein LOC110465232 isoform X2 [Mizuhopecten yessoensis]|nr:uncharacterized protein LOC110465232 isoform X2 [Mizuhopecten yessoensis]
MVILENENKIMVRRLSALEKKMLDKNNSVNALEIATERKSSVNILKPSSLPSPISTTDKDTRAKTNDNRRITDDFIDVPLKTTRRKHTVETDTSQSGIREKMMTKEKRVGPMENAVGFYAALAPDMSLGDQQDLKFDHVYTNIGQGYEPRDGHFNAPVAGLYLLSATILSAGTTTDDMLLEFVKNGVNVGQVYATRSLNEGSRVIVLSLDVGDMVWVRHMTGDPGTVANGSHYSSFSGVLISAFEKCSTSVH